MLPIGVNTSSKEQNFAEYLFRAYGYASYLISVSNNTGNIYLLNTYQPQGETSSHNSLIKLDKNFNFVWEKSLHSYGYGAALGMDIDASENIYVAQFNNTGTDTVHTVLKIDTNGNYVYDRYFRYASPAIMSPSSLNVSKNNDFFWTSGRNRNEIYINKWDLDGNAKVIGQAKLDLGARADQVTMSLDKNNNPIIAGATVSSVATLAKYDQSANLLWQRDISNFTPLSICSDSNNNIFVAGWIGPVTTTNPTIGVLIKYDSNGSIQWQKSITVTPLNSNKSSGISSIKVDSEDNIYVYYHYNCDTGITVTYLPFAFGYPSVIKFDTNGNYLWGKSVGVKYSSPDNFDQNGQLGTAIDKYNDLYLTSNLYKISGSGEPGGIIKFSPSNQHNVSSKSIPGIASTVGVDPAGAHFTFVINNSSLTDSAGAHTSSDPGYSFFYFSNGSTIVYSGIAIDSVSKVSI
jgi:hypothetical protein